MFSKKNVIFNVLRNLTIWVTFYSKFAAVSGFHKNSRSFFENSFSFQGETTFLTLWETLLFQLHPTTNFHFWRFIKKSIVFSKNPYTFFNKTKVWTFREVLFFQSPFTATSLISTIFQKNQCLFFNKPAIIFHQKT